MTIQQAVERAVAGGYDTPTANNYLAKMKQSVTAIAFADWMPDALNTFVLDPDFWRALGKTEGWEDGWSCEHGLYAIIDADKDGYCDYCEASKFLDGVRTKYGGGWRNKMHRLIDHLADGGTIEGYFETL